MVRAQMLPDYTVAERFKGQTVILFDRRRSFQVRTGPGDPVVAQERGLGVRIPFNAEGHQKFAKLVAAKGIQRQLLYLWARRIGDCLELE